MRTFLVTALFLFAVACGISQTVISNVRIDDVGHSSFRVSWDVSAYPANQRIEWGPTASYGRTIYTYAPNYSKNDNQILLSGLSTSADFDSSRTVHFRVCSDASGWVCTGDLTATLAPLPAVHPALATPPATFQISEPPTAGCTVRQIDTSMNNLQFELNNAVAAQATVCQVLNLPPATISNAQLVIPPAADADRVPVANVNTLANTVRPQTPKNTYGNGLRVRVANDSWNGDSIPTGLTEGADYCVINASGGAFNLALWPDCSTAVSLGGTGGGAWYIMPFPPPHSNYIVIRSSGLATPPDGVRADSQWLQNDHPIWYPPDVGIRSTHYSIIFRAFAHHYYIGPGIHFSTAPSNQTDTTDPMPWMGWIRTAVSNSYIAIQRNWFDGGGYPERIYYPMNLEGSFIDFSDNDQHNIDFWRPVRTGLTLTPASNAVTVAPGGFNTGLGNCTSIAGGRATLSGSDAGTAYFTVRPSDCAVIVTSGTSIACTGCSTATGSDWPRNAGGRFAHGLIGSCVYAGGSWTSCTAKDQGEFSTDSYEGTAAHIISYGPGPGRIANNFEESHEIFWHLDSTGAGTPLTMPRDYVFQRNVFATPDKYRYGSAANNGLRYENRNQWECKRCERVLLTGNEFYGNYQTSVNSGPSILVNANGVPPWQTTAGDVTIDSNWIHDANGGIMLGGGPPGSSNVPKLGRRMTVRNNLIQNMDGWTFYDKSTRSNGWGFCFQFTHGGEDITLDHNTCYSAKGTFSVAMVAVGKMIEGMKMTNNVFYFHQDSNRFGMLVDWGSYGSGTPNCFGLAGKAGLDCWLNQNYTFKGNVLIGGYTNSQTQSGNSSASALASTYSGLPGNFIPNQSSVPNRIASRKWASPATGNFRYGQASPNISGGTERATDASDVGINQDALDDALGRVKNVRSTVTASSATVMFHAPDKGGSCRVGYGTATSAVAWSQSAANTDASQERSIVLNGLTPASTYYLQVWCAGTVVTPTQVLKTLAN